MKKKYIEKELLIKVEEKTNKKLLKILNKMMLKYKLEDLIFFDDVFNFNLLELYGIERESYFEQLSKRVHKRQKEFEEYQNEEYQKNISEDY